MSAAVTFRIVDGLGRLTLERPEASNAVSPQTVADLDTALRAAEDGKCGAILLSAQGRNFCVGADLKHFASSQVPFAEELAHMADGFHAALLRLRALPCPIVAAVQGHAIGAGLGLALAADIVVAADDAKLATGYAKLGLSPDAGVSFFLTRALGPRRAATMLLTGRVLSAAEALEAGLADRIVARGDLELQADGLVRELLAGNPEAQAAIKRLTEAAWHAALAAHLDDERNRIVGIAGSPNVQALIRSMLASR